MDELINSLHNTIDYNKAEIIKLINKNDCANMKIIFEIKPLEIVTFKIECEKLATTKFDKVAPFHIGEFINNETK